MKALEVIQQIKELEPQERSKVIEFVHEIEAVDGIAYMDEKTFDQAAERVLDRHRDLMQKLAQ